MNIPRKLYCSLLKLIRLNDSNQKIALGVGVGAFFGIVPAAGPIISILAAIFLRLNKVATLAGCALTNTWITVILAVPASKIGSYLLGLNWTKVFNDFKMIFRHFAILNILNLTMLKILFPVLLGYLIIAFCFALIIYLATLSLLSMYRKKTF